MLLLIFKKIREPVLKYHLLKRKLLLDQVKMLLRILYLSNHQQSMKLQKSQKQISEYKFLLSEWISWIIKNRVL